MRAGLVALIMYAIVATCMVYWGYGQLTLAQATATEYKRLYDDEVLRTAHLKTDVLRLESKHADSRKTLRDALGANPDWSGGSVPVPVADSLCNTPGARCAPRTVPAP